MWRSLIAAINSDSACLPTKIRIALGSTQEVVLWFKCDEDIDSLVKEWIAVLDTLPELFGLPQGCSWEIQVVDDQGDVITLCVLIYLSAHRLTTSC
jgi:hypothetical protein